MIRLMHGDCLERMKGLADCSVDSIVTDPPYGLSFMGKKWDYDVPSVEIWRECLRVLKPGGHLLAFAGARTQHRMAVNIENAGFEMRDMITHLYDTNQAANEFINTLSPEQQKLMARAFSNDSLIGWGYGSGFPKSQNVGKAIDKAAGVDREVIGERDRRSTYDGANRTSNGDTGDSQAAGRASTLTICAPATDEAKQWDGWGTALKPALEPITVARKPLSEKTVAANVLEYGTGAINIDGCRVDAQGTNLGRNNNARKQEDGTSYVVQNTAMRIDNSGEKGRWPANFIHDGSEEVLSLFPVTKSGSLTAAQQINGGFKGAINCYGTAERGGEGNYAASQGSAARFFYCAKASKKDRNEGCESIELRTTQGMRANAGPAIVGADRNRTQLHNNHPTVKPVALMQYLCRLITPPGGILLDPFMGSGSTGKAAIAEGFRFIGCEMDSGYLEIAKARCDHALLKSFEDLI